MLVAGINSSGYDLPLAVGRLAARNQTDVQNYFSKVVEQEMNSPAMWMKNILHFSGGQTQSEQSLFKIYMASYAHTISDTLFGGQVHTFYKTSSAPVVINISDSITHLINGGCTMMNFFGHGSSTGFDQNIHDPAYYENRGKYPLVISNSCLTGDIHLPPSWRLSESWVLTENKGAIAFLASVDLGYSNRLHAFTTEFIQQFSYKSYGQPLGAQIRKTVNQVISNYNYDQDIINTALDFTFHGDPAVVLNSPPLPDLIVNNSSVFFSPSPVTTEQDTFSVHVAVFNPGRAVTDSFMVELIRTLPNGQSQTYYKTMHGCINSDTITFRLPVDIISGPGPNRFCVRADAGNEITEFLETNNQTCTDIIIQSGDLIPVHPYEFAIYPSSTVTLKASSAFAFSTPQQCIFQIDTNDIFDPQSPSLVQAQFTYPGGIAEWTVPFALQDCTVYYWQVSLVPQPGQSYNWKESSFIYIPGKTGWSQAHYFQFKKNQNRFIHYNRPQRTWDFSTSPHLLQCHCMGSSAITSYLDYKYSIDGIMDYSSCSPASAIHIVVIDPRTMVPWTSGMGDGAFGNINYPQCRPNREDWYLIYHANDPASLSDLNNFLRNHVPDGHYIMAYTFVNGMFQTWSDSLYTAFETMGATQVRNMQNNWPYIFFAKKGDPGTAVEYTGTSPFDVLDLSQEIENTADYGYITSTLIGPSSGWGSLHWRFDTDNSEETVLLKMTGITPSGHKDTIFHALDIDSLDVYDLENYIQANEHPFMELMLYSNDDSLRTPAWMDRWQVTYDGIPETAINPPKGYVFHKDTLDEGEILLFGVATENISGLGMDSLLVRYWITDRNNNVVPLSTRRLRPHPAGDILMDTIHFNTRGYPGLNSIWYEVNTVNSSTGLYDQREQYHFNNYAQKDFYVRSDITNPLIDVTFDGIRILNGDIVSAKPAIMISLKDENKFLALNDTSVFRVYIKDMQTGNEDRVFFGNQTIMKFIPASLPKNSCKIEYYPAFPADGKYQLRVQAKDMSENISGDYDYIIQFEVINASSITHLFNYPNPFSTSTRFVFTLTGSEIPEDLRIQIITVTGKVVKEITMAELGPVHIGNNVTDYAWNGTDTYGDQLANGVYFYRVIAKLNGSSIEHRETDADSFFHKSFGKMYLMR
jgi:hypothetical protein